MTNMVFGLSFKAHHCAITIGSVAKSWYLIYDWDRLLMGVGDGADIEVPLSIISSDYELFM